MILKVLEDVPGKMAHLCQRMDGDEAGSKLLVDIMADGGVGDVEPADLIGHTISCEYVFPARSSPDVMIAMYAKRVTPK